MKKILGLSKPVFLLGLVSLMTDLSSEMVYPILPLFLANVIGASTIFIGLVEGIAESTASILKIYSGWLSDKLGKRRPLILAGYAFSSLTKPFLAIAASGWHVLGLRFADRLGKGVRGAPRDAMIADVTEKSELGKAFGYHRAMDTVGAILGPGVTFILLLFFTQTSYRLIFLIAAIPALIGVLIIIFGVKEQASDRPVEPRTEAKKTPLPPRFIILLVIIGIFTLGNSSDAFVILRAQNIGVSAKLIPILWLFFNLTYTLVAIPAGKWSDNSGRRRVIITGFFIYALSYAGLAFAKHAWQAWVLFGVYGLYYGMTEGVIRAYIADIVPANARATCYGVYNFVIGILLLPANLLTGWLWKTFSPKVAFGTGAVLAITATILFVFFSSSFFKRSNYIS